MVEVTINFCSAWGGSGVSGTGKTLLTINLLFPSIALHMHIDYSGENSR